jgi:AcrR family transcriptional regulator
MADAARGRKRARPGGYPLRREVVAHHQRQRILAGAAAAFAERGYRQVTVADIVRSAAVARARFYENFSSKEDCFFALYDSAVTAALKATAAGCEGQLGEFPDRVRAGLEALLAELESDPAVARAWIVEGPAVGTAIDPRFERLIGDFAALLRSGRAGVTEAELPDSVEETVVGGLYWLLYYALLEEQPKRISKLLPQLTEFSLIPFAGAETARGATTAS